jgi:hypothetical protein
LATARAQRSHAHCTSVGMTCRASPRPLRCDAAARPRTCRPLVSLLVYCVLHPCNHSRPSPTCMQECNRHEPFSTPHLAVSYVVTQRHHHARTSALCHTTCPCTLRSCRHPRLVQSCIHDCSPEGRAGTPPKAVALCICNTVARPFKHRHSGFLALLPAHSHHVQPQNAHTHSKCFQHIQASRTQTFLPAAHLAERSREQSSGT